MGGKWAFGFGTLKNIIMNSIIIIVECNIMEDQLPNISILHRVINIVFNLIFLLLLPVVITEFWLSKTLGSNLTE